MIGCSFCRSTTVKRIQKTAGGWVAGWSAFTAIGLALFVHFLELMVAFLQAFIFTMLTAQFIGMSVHPAH